MEPEKYSCLKKFGEKLDQIDRLNKCKELDNQINIIENELFDCFDDKSTNAVLNISFNDVRNLVRSIKNKCKIIRNFNFQ